MNVYEVGFEKTKLVVIDGFVQDPENLIDQAASLAPFPAIEGNYYPGLRRFITADDGESHAYVDASCRALAPVLNQVYGVPNFELVEASYSMVTQQPDTLEALQSIPHFDHPNDLSFAILHYLSIQPRGGTAFYRHRRTGFENMSMERLERFKAGLDKDLQDYGPPKGYFSGSVQGFDEIASVEGLFNRAVIYPGSLLHSGQLPAGFDFSPDPRKGRLTANIFIRAIRPNG